MEFPLSFDLLRRLPRHPDWKYELIDGVALLSPRPKPLGFVRPTALPVASPGTGPSVRAITPAVRPAVAALLRSVWIGEDPYRSIAPPFGADELERHIEKSAASSGFVVADDAGEVQACAVVQPTAPPTLAWVTVAPDARELGLGTNLLAAVCADLRARGEPLVASYASAANVASLRWHLSRGFELTPERLRLRA